MSVPCLYLISFVIIICLIKVNFRFLKWFMLLSISGVILIYRYAISGMVDRIFCGIFLFSHENFRTMGLVEKGVYLFISLIFATSESLRKPSHDRFCCYPDL